MLKRALTPLFALMLLTACSPAAVQVLPTPLPTATDTPTATLTRTPGFDTTPSATFTRVVLTATGGPSPTSLLGATSTLAGDQPTPTRPRNPNAPRIEFFTPDSVAVSPGGSITLFWSTRGANGAVIYRLDREGQREQLWNVPPDGNLTVPTRRSDRGQIDFVLSVGEGALQVEQALSIPLACPDQWFFQPALETCPNAPAELTNLIEERFERGRMFYIEDSNLVYALFNDGREPAWRQFENRYNPAIHPESEASFVPPPGLVQPLRILGFIWRGSDTVRNRLGLALEPEFSYEGSTQEETLPDGSEALYISSVDGTVVQLLPNGDAWQIITPP